MVLELIIGVDGKVGGDKREPRTILQAIFQKISDLATAAVVFNGR
jgi:hypothetical protein